MIMTAVVSFFLGAFLMERSADTKYNRLVSKYEKLHNEVHNGN